MIITFVLDSFHDESNGIVMSVKRYTKVLHDMGHEIRLLTSLTKGDLPYLKTYELGIKKTPVVSRQAQKQGFYFSKINKKVIKKVISESDVIHLLLPFKLEKVALKIAKKLKKPVTAAFHLQPEMAARSINIKQKNIINIIDKKFKVFYNKIEHIHYPTSMIANDNKERGYTSKQHIISNGVPEYFKDLNLEKDEELKDKFVICMVGRLSKEKRQDLIIEAVLKSKYEKQIQIILCGKGPNKENLEELADKLTNKIIIKFLNETDLNILLNKCDLYIHASDCDVEGMSCIEAISAGLVPVISDSKLSATPQFAIDDNSLFKNGDTEDLKNKIEFFIEHKDLKKEYKERYKKEIVPLYKLENAVADFEKMLKEAIKDNNA